jgi:hypothetical protein
MCEECITPAQLRRGIKPLFCGCGCLGVRRFFTPEEEIEILEDYRRQLQKEIIGVEEAIKEIKRGVR